MRFGAPLRLLAGFKMVTTTSRAKNTGKIPRLDLNESVGTRQFLDLKKRFPPRLLPQHPISVLTPR